MPQINAKYDKEVELDVRHWIEQVLGEHVDWGTVDDSPGCAFADALKNGEVLCKYDICSSRIFFNDTKVVPNACRVASWSVVTIRQSRKVGCSVHEDGSTAFSKLLYSSTKAVTKSKVVFTLLLIG